MRGPDWDGTGREVLAAEEDWTVAVVVEGVVVVFFDATRVGSIRRARVYGPQMEV